MTLPDLPAKCIACPSQAVSVATIDGREVWCCAQCEAWLARPGGITSASRGRVLA